MSALIYKEPKKLSRPFKRGDLVEVCDRNLESFGEVQRVVYAGPKVVRTKCGRAWRASDGWYIGESGTWPFPSIRHVKATRKAT